MISVAARMVNCHPQTLRTYERMGLLEPSRTRTNLRLYSDQDVERARQIQRLTQELGVNLAGVEVVLDLLDRMESHRRELEEQMEAHVREMEAEIHRLRAALRVHGLEREE